ncbi:MAG: VWA domain-containing protein [Pyrinomonadaceae bacterium]
MLKKILFISFLTLFFLPTLISAQNKSKSSDEKGTSADSPIEIKANVLVLDAEGRVADDINQNDIKIFEDGVEQKITYFAKKEPVTNLGLLIDNTGSMRFQLEKILETSSKIVNNLGENDEAFIVRFVNTEKTRIFLDWTSSKPLLNRAISNMYVEGGISAITDAINLGWMKITQREKENDRQKYALVLISDCEERNSVSDLSQILFKMKNTDIQIHVIALTEELNLESMVRGIGKPKDKKKGTPKENAEAFAAYLAFQTGGRAFILDKKSKMSVDDIVKNLTDELRSQIVIKYVSTNPNRGNRERKLTVQIADDENGRKRRGVIRENFIVPKE